MNGRELEKLIEKREKEIVDLRKKTGGEEKEGARTTKTKGKRPDETIIDIDEQVKRIEKDIESDRENTPLKELNLTVTKPGKLSTGKRGRRRLTEHRDSEQKLQRQKWREYKQNKKRKDSDETKQKTTRKKPKLEDWDETFSDTDTDESNTNPGERHLTPEKRKIQLRKELAVRIERKEEIDSLVRKTLYYPEFYPITQNTIAMPLSKISGRENAAAKAVANIAHENGWDLWVGFQPNLTQPPNDTISPAVQITRVEN